MSFFLPFAMCDRIVRNPFCLVATAPRRRTITSWIGQALLLLGLLVSCFRPVVGQDANAAASIGIQGAPFSAVQTTITKTLLPGGGYKLTTKELILARSSDGLVRREVHEPIDGDPDGKFTPITMVVILDTAKNSAFFIYPASRTATVSQHPNSKAPRIERARTSAPLNATQSLAPSLGEGNVGGIRVLGRRDSYTVKTVDGGQNATVTRDTWYSPELHLVAKTETHDSLGNSEITTLAEIKQTEPDPLLFRIPDGYSVKTLVKAK